MNRILFGLALVALGTGSEAIAGTCNVQSTRAPGHWKFIKVYDVDTGKVVLQKVFNGGEHREVVVRGERVRVDWKLPGGKDYKPGAVVICKDGNTVRS
jgi:hypothetical protein